MELQECITERRSVRKYADKEVPLPLIAEIMEHARLAPSAGNSQNWRFIIVLDREKRIKISEAANKPWMKEAPVHIAVCNYSKKAYSSLCRIRQDVLNSGLRNNCVLHSTACC